MENYGRIGGASGTCPELEELLDFACEVQEGKVQDPRADEHITQCDACLRELSAIQRDLIHAGAAGKSPAAKVPTFQVEKGLLLNPLRFLFHPAGPVFRSGGSSVIHSTIIPLEQNYVLLELTGAESGMKLHLEKGAKNGGLIRISLYINDQLSDKRKLHESLSWDIHAFSPGHYRLQLEGKTVLTFDIKE